MSEEKRVLISSGRVGSYVRIELKLSILKSVSINRYDENLFYSDNFNHVSEVGLPLPDLDIFITSIYPDQNLVVESKDGKTYMYSDSKFELVV